LHNPDFLDIVFPIMTLHETATEIIDALGGTSAVADLTGSSATAVSNWRAVNRLPSNTYLVIKDALARLGRAAPDHLWSMREPPAKRKRERA
jgi:hypothetical protein